MKRVLFLTLLSMVIVSCDDSVMDEPLENKAPVVSVFLAADSVGSLNRTSSNQILHWDGKDPDGLVVGFYYTFGNSADRNNWIFLDDTGPEGPELINSVIPSWRFTTDRTDTFSLSILTDTVTYTFSVLAVDEKDKLSDEPARLVLPIKNSKPEVFFLGQIDFASSAVKIPDTTFTIASFAWGVTDLDGDDTIDKFQYAITDSGSDSDTIWVDISSTKRSILLSGTQYETDADVTFDDRLREGLHAFHLRAIDVAGAESDIKRLPEDENKYWYVKEPARDILLVDDWAINSSDGRQDYIQILDSLSNLKAGREYSILDIKPQNSEYLLSILALSETIKLFKAVIWYSDVNPKLDEADAALGEYNKNGGKVIFSTLFSQFGSNRGDPLEFTPVDSIDIIRDTTSNATEVTKIFKSWDVAVWPDPLVSASFPDTLLPALPASIIPSPKALVPKSSSRVLYRYQELPERYAGKPIVIVEDANKSFIMSSIPLHYFNGANNLGRLIDLFLSQEFGL